MLMGQEEEENESQRGRFIILFKLQIKIDV